MKGKGITKKVFLSIILIVMLVMTCGEAMAYTIKKASKRSDGKVYSYNGTTRYKYSVVDQNSEAYCLNGYAHLDSGNTSGYSKYSYNGKTNILDLNVNSTIATNFKNTTGVPLRTEYQFKNINGAYYSGQYKTLKALQWLAQNIYYNKADNSDKALMKSHLTNIIKKYYKTDYNNGKINIDNLDEPHIAIIQQYVFWNFMSGHTLYDLTLTNVKNITGINNDIKATTAYDLYAALTRGAIDYVNGANNIRSISMKYNSAKTFKITSSNKTITVKNGSYIAGPFKITATDLESLSVSYTKSNKNINIKSWSIVDANGNTLTKDKTLVGKNFYFKFTTNEEMEKNPGIKLKFNYKFTPGLKSCNASVYYKSNRQPMFAFQKAVSQKSDKTNITLSYNPTEYNFDFALTKNITAVYKYDQVNKEYIGTSIKRNLTQSTTWRSDESTTHKYTANKTPIEVSKGDIIRYQIKIWNEGDTNGYVTSVQDIIPEGLKFLGVVKDSDGNVIKTNYSESNYNNNQNTNNQDIKVKSTSDMVNNTIDFSFSKSQIDTSNKGLLIKSGKSTSFSFECKVTDDANVGDTLINLAAITEYGYKNTLGKYVKCSDTDVDRDSIQDNLDTDNFEDYAKGINWSLNDTDNNLTSMDKGNWVDEDDEDFEAIKIVGFDMALRKSIYSITTNGKTTIIDRKPSSYLYGSYNMDKQKTSIGYYHRKNPITVKDGSEICYRIRIYNEGYIAGYAKEITDYLPAGLTYISAHGQNNTYKWSATPNTNDGTTTVKTNYLENEIIAPANGKTGFKELEEQGESSFSGEKFWKDVYINCKVDASKITNTDSNILTNVAEITNYGYYTAKDISKNNMEHKWIASEYSEVDSEQNTVLSGNGGNSVEALTVAYSYAIGEKKKENLYYGAEDDDDFESVEVKESTFDLALRKFIVKVGDTIPDNREPEITEDSVEALKTDNTAIYYHSKKPIEVETGDTILYKLRIYNEGEKEGTVKELVDYLPEGLELKEEGKNGWYTDKNIDGTVKKNADGSTTIRRQVEFIIKPSNGTEGYEKLASGTAIVDSDKFWKDIEIECKLTSLENEKVLTNVAEISNYGYYDAENNYIEANITDIDLDSEEDNVFTSISNINQYYANREYEEAIYAYEGEQDDDDFESIKVVSKFDIKLEIRKIDENGNEIHGTRYSRSTI